MKLKNWKIEKLKKNEIIDAKLSQKMGFDQRSGENTKTLVKGFIFVAF